MWQRPVPATRPGVPADVACMGKYGHRVNEHTAGTPTCWVGCTLTAAPEQCGMQVLVWDLRSHDNGSLLETSRSKATSAAAAEGPELPAASVLQVWPSALTPCLQQGVADCVSHVPRGPAPPLPPQRRSWTLCNFPPCPPRQSWRESSVQGHTRTVEDVVFMPKSEDELVSVGDDQTVLLWDRR